MEQHPFVHVFERQVQAVIGFGPGQKFVDQERMFSHHPGLLFRNKLGIFVAQRQQTTGFASHNWNALPRKIVKTGHVRPSQFSRLVQHSLGDHGPAATPAVNQLYLVAGCFQKLNRSDANFRVVVVHKRVVVQRNGPEFGGRYPAAVALGKPVWQRLPGEPWLLTA